MTRAGLFGLESRHQPLLSLEAFVWRFAKSTVVGLATIGLSLIVGMLGYHMFEGMCWIDAFANAAMILGGMGPLTPLTTDAGKLFAGVYALWCGLALIVAVGIILAPVVHRVLHRFHLESELQG
jgi:hypothetical protein